MVVITVKGHRGQRFVSSLIVPQAPATNNNKWQIVKRTRINPLTLADQPYNPDFYRESIRAGSIEGAKIQNWTTGDGEHIRAIQTMLHLQTNYNALLMSGLYRQPRAVVEQCLRTWYEAIADQFPAYARWCRFELARHMRKFDAREGADYRFVA